MRCRPSDIAGAGKRAALTRLVDFMITALVLLAVVGIFTISSAMMTSWKLHYITAGGAFYEKLHPATYCTVLAFGLLLIRNGDPIGDLLRTFSDARLLLIFLLCWFWLLVQMLMQGLPFTVIIDTFLLPLLLCVVIWRLSPAQRRPLVWAIHIAILVNVVIGYYEYFSGHRLFPLTLGDVVIHGEWRASALLGHPLTAAGVVAGYIIALTFGPSMGLPTLLRLPIIAVALASLMAFGGRTSLVTVLVMMGAGAAFQMFRLLRGGRTSLLTVILALCALFIGVAVFFAAYDAGLFDKMLIRFSSDKGSTLARYATFDFLSHFDRHELLFGPDPVRASALQDALGLKYGVEDFWVSCIVQFGIISTSILTIGLAALLAEIIKRASAAAWLILLLMIIIAISSVSFSSKNIQLAQFAVLIALLLPRQFVAAPVRRERRIPRPAPAYVASRA
jgi:hypothetical protein